MNSTFELVRHRLQQPRFEPFQLVTTSGKTYSVPTPDHAGTIALTKLLILLEDDGGTVTVPALHITAIEPLKRRRRPRAA